MRRALLTATIVLAAAPGAALAAGGPVTGNADVGYEGVVVPGDPQRVVAAPHSDGTTLVASVERRGGRLGQSLRIRGRFTVGSVAADGTPDGRSADGRTVVLVEPYGALNRRRSRFAVMGVYPLRLRRTIVLHGNFALDAVSPDGKRMYVVEYTHPKDPRRYVVRSYDLVGNRLEPDVIVDAREPDEQMRGFPLSRVTSANGRWAYTLYDGVGEPFIHALDTAGRRAFCIDLPMLAHNADPYSMRLGLGESGVSVLVAGKPLAMVDTHTMRAHEPPVARPAQRPRRPATAGAGGDSGPDWALAGGLALLGIVVAGGLRALLRRRAYR